MFEEGLVITLLLAIFFVVFYIIYNNSCGCNKSLIENFENKNENRFEKYINSLIDNKLDAMDITNLGEKKPLLDKINEEINEKLREDNRFENENFQKYFNDNKDWKIEEWIIDTVPTMIKNKETMIKNKEWIKEHNNGHLPSMDILQPYQNTIRPINTNN